jgi:hypothetical protein
MERIDVNRLKRQEPIYLIDEVVLYEDELADNGISQLSVKFVRISFFIHFTINTRRIDYYCRVPPNNSLSLGSLIRFSQYIQSKKLAFYQPFNMKKKVVGFFQMECAVLSILKSILCILFKMKNVKRGSQWSKLFEMQQYLEMIF